MRNYLTSFLTGTLLLAGIPAVSQSVRTLSSVPATEAPKTTPYGACDAAHTSARMPAQQKPNPGPDPGPHVDGPAYDELSFYVIAHQDDWQLFMGSYAQNDMATFHEQGQLMSTNPDVYDTRPTGGGKVVFIYVTAGASVDDAIKGIDPHTPTPNSSPYVNRNVPYYLVREQGAINSIQLGANRNGFPEAPYEPWPVDGLVTINGHKMRRYAYKNTVSYFMRIDTGSFGTLGYFGSNAPGYVAPTVDGNSTYTSWCDIVNTVGLVYQTEMATVPNVIPWLNVPDSDTYPGQNISATTHDHDGHLLAGRAGIQAAKSIGQNFPTCLYVGYPCVDFGDNLSMPDAQNEAGLAAVYNMAIVDYRLWTEWHDTQGNALFQKWTASNWCRVSNVNDIWTKDCNDYSNPGDYGRPTAGAKVAGSIQQMELYPNPASKHFSVKVPSNSTLLEVRLRDMSGKEVKYIDGNKEEVEVDLSNVASGMYNVWIVQVDKITKKQTIVVRKVVVESRH